MAKSRDVRLVLKCACGAESANSALRGLCDPSDWSQVVGMARQYRFASALYCALSESAVRETVPRSVLHELRSSYLRDAVQSFRTTLELNRILAAFLQEELPAIVLKGKALQALVYKRIGLRPMVDADVLVKRDDVDSAERVLTELGYIADESFRAKDWYKMHHHHLAPFLAPDGSTTIEIHHHLVRPYGPLQLPIPEFWQRSRAIRMGSTSMRVFSAEDLLLHVCIHLSFSNRFAGALSGIRDIVWAIAVLGEELDWDAFINRVERYHAASYVYYSLWLAQELMDAVVPIDVIRSLRRLTRGGLPDSLLRIVIPRIALCKFPAFWSWRMQRLCGALLAGSGAAPPRARPER